MNDGSKNWQIIKGGSLWFICGVLKFKYCNEMEKMIAFLKYPISTLLSV